MLQNKFEQVISVFRMMKTSSSSLDAMLFPSRQQKNAWPQSLAGDARSSNRRRRQHRRCRLNGKQPQSNYCSGVYIQIESRVLACYENLFAHTVAVVRLCLSKYKDLIILFTFFYVLALSANVNFTSKLLYYPTLGKFKLMEELL